MPLRGSSNLLASDSSIRGPPGTLLPILIPKSMSHKWGIEPVGEKVWASLEVYLEQFAVFLKLGEE